MRLLVVVIVLGALAYFGYQKGWITKAMLTPSASDKGSTS
jgi:hypothetical protein